MNLYVDLFMTHSSHLIFHQRLCLQPPLPAGSWTPAFLARDCEIGRVTGTMAPRSFTETQILGKLRMEVRKNSVNHARLDVAMTDIRRPSDLVQKCTLDDGWPESVEEQGLLLLVCRRNFRNDLWKMCYRQSRRGVSRQDSKKCKTIVCIADTLLHTYTFTHKSF